MRINFNRCSYYVKIYHACVIADNVWNYILYCGHIKLSLTTIIECLVNIIFVIHQLLLVTKSMNRKWFRSDIISLKRLIKFLMDHFLLFFFFCRRTEENWSMSKMSDFLSSLNGVKARFFYLIIHIFS